MNRREFLRRNAGIAGAIGIAPFFTSVAFGSSKVSIVEAFDREMENYMKPREIPGGALAVVKDRRLVYVRGYGWADREKQEAARPDSLFRIASISKPFTAAAIVRLVAEGRISMDTPAFHVLEMQAAPGGDARLSKITVRHLLHHTGGWDRDKSGDPMFMSKKIANAMNAPEPARQDAIIRYMLRQSLDFEPGQRFAYSNFGYCVLGRIIEKVTGREYAAYLRDNILAPIGIERMRLGVSLEAGRAPGEVKYYMRPAETAASVFSGETGRVSVPYGGFCLEAMDSHGGWLASAVDLARFAAAMDDPDKESWLPHTARKLLYEPPAPPVGRKADGSLEAAYYGCGWDVRPIGKAGKANYWHNGSLPGTFTLLVRRWDGLSWAALFNQRSTDGKPPDGAIDGALHRAADSVAEWPAHNLF
jgi:N-acyl-D-amino-acid deacylase